ncbi:MAG: PIN domain-containing protein [Candidatus Nanohaloarchaea archaeon]
MILDTNFIIDVMNGDKEALNKLDKLENSSSPVSTTAITLFELWSGINRSNKSEEEKEKVMNVISSLTIFSLDEKSARIAGRIDGVLADNKEKMSPEDCKIAGIAIKNSEKVVTKDRDFSTIQKYSTLEIE